MKDLDSNRCAQQLKKRWVSPYLWDRKQQDDKNCKLKAEISWLKELIETFIPKISPAQFLKIEFKPDVIIFSGLIWATK